MSHQLQLADTMKNRSVCFSSVILFLLAFSPDAAQVLAGAQPLVNAPTRFSIDVFPLALGYRNVGNEAFWHGTSVGITLDADTRLASFTYGGGFFGINSGGVFMGPLVDLQRRYIGLTVDVVYCFFAAALKLSLHRIASSRPSDMAFAVTLSGGFGVPYPLVRLEEGYFRTLFDR